ncbi:MAG TPA: ComEC/Rec2 family competence protein, partial [Candidatus Megaira endosymbiont of Hartmannula sinica]|nr:ComEC/Rec2 family competence protein [Candidatus Megaera endosymbiont of Hartmannula sinica]
MSRSNINKINNKNLFIDKENTAVLKGEVNNITKYPNGNSYLIGNLSYIKLIESNSVNINNIPSKFLIKIYLSNKIIKKSKINIGDVVAVRVTIFPLQGQIMPGGYNFKKYLQMNNILSSAYGLRLMDLQEYSINNQVEKDNYSMMINVIQKYINHSLIKIRRVINDLRNIIYARLSSNMSTVTARFLAAILIGENKMVDSNVMNDIRNSGVSHILCVSGLHLSLVSFLVYQTIMFMLSIASINYQQKKLYSGILSIIAGFLYLTLTDFGIAAVRAFIMASVFIISMLIHRVQDNLRNLIFAAVILLLLYPEYLTHPSFQLSFIAVLSLIVSLNLPLYYQVNNQTFIDNILNIKFLIKYLVGNSIIATILNIYSSIIIWFVTMPFVIYHFFSSCNYTILSNIIAVPMMVIVIMPLGIIALLLMPFGFETYILRQLSFFIEILINFTKYTASLPYSVWYKGYLSSHSLIIFSLGIALLFFCKTKIKFSGLLIIFIAIILIFDVKTPAVIYNKERNIKITYEEKESNKLSDKNFRKKILSIYSVNKLSKFEVDYIKSWYGFNNHAYNKENNIIIKNIPTSPHYLNHHS